MELGLTKKQLYVFFQAANKAALAMKENREEYRKRIMLEECKLESTKLMDRRIDFERCMIRMLTDAEDYQTAARYMGGSARRIGHLCNICANQILQISQDRQSSNPDVAYMAGILNQAKIGVRLNGDSWYLDVPEAISLKLFSMLDSHRRRLLRRAGFNGGLTFCHSGSYVWYNGRLVLMRDLPAVPITKAG